MANSNASCDCIFCKQNHDIEPEQDLLEAVVSGDTALFAGAGISTESRTVFPFNFYEMVAKETGVDDEGLTFPEMMDHLCNQVNGRYKLIRLLKSRFDTIDSFPELYQTATTFHRELATLHPINTIITTNWDTYFEDNCRATPFITDKDLAFWDDAKRRVLKLHGCIRSYGSLVANSEDYQKCEDYLDKGILGSTLKTIIATRTIVFVGYSMRDQDFRSIYELVKRQMEGMHKQAYIVTPFEKEAEDFKKEGLIPIITSGSHFIRELKKHAQSYGAMLPDSIYDDALELRKTLELEHRRLHDSLSAADHPQIIFSAFYQDGMIHALDRVLNLRGSGEYSHSCTLTAAIHTYLDIQKTKRKQKRYDDVAYIEGYINSLFFVLLSGTENEVTDPPLYFAFGYDDDIYNLDHFVYIASDLPNKHKSSYRQAEKLLGKLNDPRSVEMHHPPWL